MNDDDMNFNTLFHEASKSPDFSPQNQEKSHRRPKKQAEPTSETQLSIAKQFEAKFQLNPQMPTNSSAQQLGDLVRKRRQCLNALEQEQKERKLLQAQKFQLKIPDPGEGLVLLNRIKVRKNV